MVNVNINFLCYSLNLNHSSFVNFLVSSDVKNLISYLSLSTNTSIEDQCICQSIIELIKIQKGELYSLLTYAEATQLLIFLCTH